MILCLNSRPWEGKKLLRQSLCFRRLQRQLWPLVSLCLRTWCDVTLQNGADDQSLWWQQGILSGSSSNQGLQRAAALPSTWAAAPCHWTRRLIFTRNTDGRDKKLLSPHCHLGQIGWMTSGFFFFWMWSYFSLLTALRVVSWLGKEGWMVTPLQEPHRHLSCCAAAGVTPLGNTSQTP